MVVISLVEERSSVYSMAGRPLGLLFSKLQVKHTTTASLVEFDNVHWFRFASKKIAFTNRAVLT